jgi:hypothetical protein
VILARLPLARLVRAPRAWMSIVACAALAFVTAVAFRHVASAHGAGDALLGAYGGLALPLSAYAIVASTLGGEGVARAVRPLASFGASPFSAALAAIAVAVIASAVVGGALGAAVASIAHGAGDPPLARDVATSAWIGALGGAAYAALFAFGSSFGRRGGGRALALVVDFVLGGGSGAASLLTPRAHVRSLLGGSAPLDLSQRGSVAALVVLVAAFAGLAVLRARRGA